jgi:hypothetical protein
MLTPYRRAHLDMMPLSPIVGLHMTAENRRILETLGEEGLAFTIFAGDKVLGVAGAVPLPGKESTAEVFVVAAEDRAVRGRTFTRGVVAVLRQARERFARIEAIADSDVAPRWFEWLGFTEADGRWTMKGGVD